MIAAKHADRLALLRDAEYFSTELVRRLDRLAKVEPHDQRIVDWQQASAITSRVRSFTRHQSDEMRRKANRVLA